MHRRTISVVAVLPSVLLLAVWAAFAAPAAARPAVPQQATPPAQTVTDDDVNRIARQLYCPVCESIPLDVCSTKACADWRALIRQKLAAGETDQQIIDYFVATYGDRVLAQPPQRGFNWLVYVVPPLVLLGGALLAWRVLGGLVHREPETARARPEPQDEYVARIEREVREGDDE